MNPTPLVGELTVPADKSITHRAILFSALAEGTSTFVATSMGRDNLASLRIICQLDVAVSGQLNEKVYQMAEEEGLLQSPTGEFSRSPNEFNTLVIKGRGWRGLRIPEQELDCGNSGTTARLLTGLLAGCPFSATLTGDQSLCGRPFKRVVEPLSKMGARFSAEMLPLTVTGGALRGVEWVSPQASAQVKSALLIAGLQAEGEVSVVEPRQSRDHTERMFVAMGCELESGADSEGRWRVELLSQRSALQAINFNVPGDYSAAAFFLVAASILPGSKVLLKDVGVNPTRTGLHVILQRMGARIDFSNHRQEAGEPVADITVNGANLVAAEVSAEDVVLAIDEVPVLAVAAAFARGKTIIRGCQELRVKESDRVKTTVSLLKSFGFAVTEHSDGMDIEGAGGLAEARAQFAAHCQSPSDQDIEWQQGKDHRILMSAAILRYALSGELELDFPEAVETSFPQFIEKLRQVSRK